MLQISSAIKAHIDTNILGIARQTGRAGLYVNVILSLTQIDHKMSYKCLEECSEHNFFF